MPILQAVNLEASAADTFKRLIDLITPASSAVEGEIVNGVFSFEDNACQFLLVPKGTPQAGYTGQKWPAGSFRGEGPNVEPGSGLRLETIWVKNTVAASVSKVCFTGAIRTVA